MHLQGYTIQAQFLCICLFLFFFNIRSHVQFEPARIAQHDDRTLSAWLLQSTLALKQNQRSRSPHPAVRHAHREICGALADAGASRKKEQKAERVPAHAALLPRCTQPRGPLPPLVLTPLRPSPAPRHRPAPCGAGTVAHLAARSRRPGPASLEHDPHRPPAPRCRPGPATRTSPGAARPAPGAAAKMAARPGGARGRPPAEARAAGSLPAPSGE